MPPAESARTAAPAPATEADHVLGAEEPGVTLLDYGDFGCPHCFASWRPVYRELQLNPHAVEDAVRNHTFREPVDEDIADGERAGAHGTPTFFIDGVRLISHWHQLAETIPSAIERA